MDEAHFLTIVLLALGCGLMGELLGHNAMIGPLLLGLVLPGGPPLGTTLADRLDRFVGGILLPVYVATTGLRMNLSALREDEGWGFLSVLLGASSVVKFVVVLGVCFYCKMPVREGVVVGLMMNCKGIMELHALNGWHDYKVRLTILFISLLFL